MQAQSEGHSDSKLEAVSQHSSISILHWLLQASTAAHRQTANLSARDCDSLVCCPLRGAHVSPHNESDDRCEADAEARWRRQEGTTEWTLFLSLFTAPVACCCPFTSHILCQRVKPLAVSIACERLPVRLTIHL